MPLATAPNTLTIAYGDSKEATLTLVDVADNKVTYRVTAMDTWTPGSTLEAPVIVITRRPATPQNGAARYEIRGSKPVFDVTGKVVAVSRSEHTTIVPTLSLYDVQLQAFQEVCGVIAGSPEVIEVTKDQSFFR